MTLVSVPVAARDISAGEQLKPSDIRILRVRPDSVLKGCLSSVAGAVGKYAGCDVVEGQQILESYLTAGKDVIDPGTSVFSLRPEWIYARSALLRSGDLVDVYIVTYEEPVAENEGEVPEESELNGPSSGELPAAENKVPGEPEYLGRYKIAGVFDSIERRTEESGAAIYSVEIYCSLFDYMDLCRIAAGREDPFLLLCEVLEGDR